MARLVTRLLPSQRYFPLKILSPSQDQAGNSRIFKLHTSKNTCASEDCSLLSITTTSVTVEVTMVNSASYVHDHMYKIMTTIIKENK